MTMQIEGKDILTWTVIVALGTLLGFAINTNTQAINDAHRALCNQKIQAARNVKDTKAYLVQHPGGVKALGLSRGVLLRSITLNEKQVTALGDVSCTP